MAFHMKQPYDYGVQQTKLKMQMSKAKMSHAYVNYLY